MSVITRFNKLTLSAFFREVHALCGELFEGRKRTPAERADLVERTKHLISEFCERYEPTMGPESRWSSDHYQTHHLEFRTQSFLDFYESNARHERWRTYRRAVEWVFGDGNREDAELWDREVVRHDILAGNRSCVAQASDEGLRQQIEALEAEWHRRYPHGRVEHGLKTGSQASPSL